MFTKEVKITLDDSNRTGIAREEIIYRLFGIVLYKKFINHPKFSKDEDANYETYLRQ